MRDELHFRLKELHRLVQCSRFLLAREQKYLCLLEAGESGKMLSSQITDELKLVAHPVGSCSFPVENLNISHEQKKKGSSEADSSTRPGSRES
jgi:hypothetical protein